MDFNHFKNSSSSLRDDQMKDIKGGYGTCGYKTKSGTWDCNVSKNEALFMADSAGDHWCCDSCYKSSYCGDGQSSSYSGSW